jgi:hypothetical protein
MAMEVTNQEHHRFQGRDDQGSYQVDSHGLRASAGWRFGENMVETPHEDSLVELKFTSRSTGVAGRSRRFCVVQASGPTGQNRAFAFVN